jgi:hypothetical protein
MMVNHIAHVAPSDNLRSSKTFKLSMFTTVVFIVSLLSSFEVHVNAFVTTHSRVGRIYDSTNYHHRKISLFRARSKLIHAVPKKDVATSNENESSSKRSMLAFALPALGIYLANPLLSNIDNAFVGKTSGTTGLAALSPGTTCSDQLLYFFSFLARATTGIVSRAYSSPTNGVETLSSTNNQGNSEAAREAGSARKYIS